MQLETRPTEVSGISPLWKVTSKFNSEAHKLDIEVDFERGSTFEYECDLYARVPRIKIFSGRVIMLLSTLDVK